jgi:hypothetical protein
MLTLGLEPNPGLGGCIKHDCQSRFRGINQKDGMSAHEELTAVTVPHLVGSLAGQHVCFEVPS